MRRSIVALAMAMAAGMAAAVSAEVPPRPPVLPAAKLDYRDAADWVCRPGQADVCASGLDAVTIDAAGRRTPRPFRPDPKAPVDCFYLYPTISHDPSFYSDMTPSDAEEREVTRAQAGLLGESCRVFAPLYRSLTNAALGWYAGGGAAGKPVDTLLETPYRDVLAAWRDYLARDNHGRGVVLIGHSQGAILLKRLIQQEIDGKPIGRRLVAAYLGGNPDLNRASFRTIKPCRSASDTGCVVAWSSYLEGDTATPRAFGGAKGGAGLCVDPASPAGGRGALRVFLPRLPDAPADAPPFFEAVGQLSAECVTDEAGAVLRVRIEPSVAAPIWRRVLDGKSRFGGGWGLHRYDLSLVQGNLPGLIASQGRAWAVR